MTLDTTVRPAFREGALGCEFHHLEIYEPDVLAEEMQPVLRYAASLFGPK